MLQKGACFCESFTINDKGFFINSGVANNGMKIDMFLDQSGKIISALIVSNDLWKNWAKEKGSDEPWKL